MTRDDLISETLNLGSDIRSNEKFLEQEVVFKQNHEKQLERQRLLIETTKKSLVSLIKGPIISLAEFKSLKTGLQVANLAETQFEKELATSQEMISTAQKHLVWGRKKLAELEVQLDLVENYSATVLELKK